MPKLTYFPLLMDRWVAGTRELTFEQKGFYIDLLVYLYDSGKPIKDADHAARITGCDPRTSRRLLADLSQKFYRRSDGLRHKLVSEILKKGGRIKTLGTFENLTEQRSDPEPDPEPEEKKKKPSVSKKKSPAEQTGKRLSEDWQPSPDLIAWIRETYPQIDPRLETERFRDYWLSMPGQRGRKVDWDRTWRNWARKAADDAARRRGQPQASPQRPRPPADYYNPDGSVNERYAKPNGRRYSGAWENPESLANSAQTVATVDAEKRGRCGTVVDADAGACLAAIRDAASCPGGRQK